MKPLKIEFAAFGSYPGAVTVNFAVLAARGLFVVTGDTGTGKTTIFDAMSYALFGEMPLKPGNDIRSHHADPTQTTFARFTFEVDGARYVAERSPDQPRPALRGGGVTTEKAKASLTRVDGEGSTARSTTLATKVSDMKRAVAEVVGLDAEQFQRVMLLPQGEVARFLLDDSSDREVLLSTLFGGAVYDRIATALQQEAQRLRAQVAQADEALRHHLTNAHDRVDELQQFLEIDLSLSPDAEREAFDEVRTVCQAPLTALRHASDAAVRQAAEHATALADARQAAQRYLDANTVRTALAELQAGAAAVEASAVAAEASARARPVVVAAAQYDDQSAAALDATRHVEASRAAVIDVANRHGLTVRTETAETLAADLDDVATTVRTQTELLDAVIRADSELSRAVEALDRHRGDLETARSEAATQAQRMTAIDQRLEALEGSTGRLDLIDGEIARLQSALTLVDQRDQAADDVDTCADRVHQAELHAEQVLRRFVETTAPRLAAQLVPGAPCMVCGSVDHPAPALVDQGEPVDLDAVAAAQTKVDGARRALNAAQARVTESQARLGEWSASTADDLRDRLAASQDQRDAVQADCDEAASLAVERREVDARRAQAQSDVDRLAGIIDAGQTTVTNLEASLAQATAAAAGLEAAQVQVLETALAELRSHAADLNRYRSDAQAAQAAVTVAATTLEQALEVSGFADVATARAAVMSSDDEQQALDQRQRLHTTLQQLHGQLQQLESQGIPDVLPEVDTLADVAAQADETAREMARRRTLADKAAADVTSHLDQYDQLGADSHDLRQRARLTEKAQLVCRGQVGAKVSLRRWVLGRELDRVVAAASVHLTQMTSGRYTIRRVVEVTGGRSAKGLELEVLDAHTGRARSPRTLSGGEQFQASLALALGLADVVSHGGTGSGRRIEALFVDEGFGSLDPRALDDAIETLHHLHASGRMIGAITHVEAMKERLHPGIVVTRLPDGKGSTLRVNP